MFRSPHTVAGMFLGVISIAAIGVSVLHADAQSAIGQEELEIRAGSVFEILADSDIPNAQYGWVLAQDRTFVQAGREALFRTRFVQPGDYALSTEVTDAERTQQVRRIIRIRVLEVDPTAPVQTSTGAVFTVTPTADAQGQVILDGNRQIIAITPTRERVSALAVDLDPQTDGNGDGDTGNDPDTASSFFSSDGTPLHVWLSSFKDEQHLTIHGVDRSGAPVRSQLRIVSPDKASPTGGEGPVQITGGIMNSVLADGRVAFAVDPSIVDLSSAPVLLHWDFGDGEQSLLEKPLHAYTAAGLYTVTVTVRNLSDGTVVRELAAQLTVEESAVQPTPAPDDGGADGDVPDPTPAPSRNGSMLGLILKAGGALIVAILLGLLGMFAFSRLRRVSTAGLDRPMGSDHQLDPKEAAIIDVAAPMELPEMPEESEATKPETAGSAPESDDGSMPSWLQPSKEPVAQESASTASAPVQDGDMPSWLSTNPSSAEPTPPPPPLPTEPATAASVDTSELPDWLQPQAPATASVIDVPAPAPEPTRAAAPESPPAPATGDGELPAWLQPQPPSPAVEPTPVVPEAPAPEPASTAPDPAPQTNDGNMPAWLQPQAPAAEGTVPEPTPAPTPLATPEPIAAPEPVAVPEPMATPAPVAEPVIVATPEPEPAPAVAAAPVAEPESVAVPETPVTEPETAPTPAIVVPVATTEQEKDAETLAQEERERERRRQKRKRYQENLKKRKLLEAAKESKPDAVSEAAQPVATPSLEPTAVQEPILATPPELAPATTPTPAALEPVVPAETVKDDGSVAFIVRADSIDQTTGEAPKPNA